MARAPLAPLALESLDSSRGNFTSLTLLTVSPAPGENVEYDSSVSITG